MKLKELIAEQLPKSEERVRKMMEALELGFSAGCKSAEMIANKRVGAVRLRTIELVGMKAKDLRFSLQKGAAKSARVAENKRLALPRLRMSACFCGAVWPGPRSLPGARS
jgi:hypothetical protein